MAIDLHPPALSYDAQGVAGIVAADAEAAFYGIGMLHVRHRQAQALQVWSAALGQLSTSLLGALPEPPRRPRPRIAAPRDDDGPGCRRRAPQPKRRRLTV